MRLNYVQCCDNIQGLAQLPDDCVDLTVTSPPYDTLRKYKGFTWDFEKLAAELYRVTKQGGVVAWIVSDATIQGSETGTSFEQALHFKKLGFCLYDTMIWLKPSPAVPTEGRYYDVFEYMFILSKGRPKTLNLLTDRPNRSAGSVSKKETRSCREDRQYKEGRRIVKETSRRFNVWEVSRGHNKTSHPAVFPEQLAADHIKTWSDPGDTVLDPFLGSGTTAVACLKTGRNYIGFEISPEYVEIAQQRITETINELLSN